MNRWCARYRQIMQTPRWIPSTGSTAPSPHRRGGPEEKPSAADPSAAIGVK